MARSAYLKIERYKNRTQRYTPSAATEAGTPVKIDISSTQCIAGVTVDDIAASGTGIVDVGNVFAFPCGAAQTFDEGDVVAWNYEGSNAIPYASMNGTDDFVLGNAYKSTTGSWVWVALNDGPTAYTRNSSSSSSSSAGS